MCVLVKGCVGVMLFVNKRNDSVAVRGTVLMGSRPQNPTFSAKGHTQTGSADFCVGVRDRAHK